MKKPGITPREQGVTLREKLIVYFVVNSGEELRITDIADKYGRSVPHIAGTVRRMRRAGLLQHKGKSKRNAPLVAGPELLALAGVRD